MLDYQTIAENLRRMAVQQESMVQAAAAFEKISSLEGVIRETEAKIAVARDKLATHEAGVEAAKKQIAGLQKDADELRDAADRDAEQVLANANAEAEAKLSVAKAEAEKVVAEANAQAQAAHDAQTLRAQLLGEQVAGLEGQVAAAEAALAAKNAAVEAAQAKLDSINAAIAEILAKTAPQA